jgi:hypothetical protein
MPIKTRVLLAMGLVAVFGTGFWLGGGFGWHLMDERCGVLLASGTAARSFDALTRHVAIWEALQAGELAAADKQLRFLIWSESAEVRGCHSEPDCAKLVPKSFYDAALLDRARSIGNLTKRSSAP